MRETPPRQFVFAAIILKRRTTARHVGSQALVLEEHRYRRYGTARRTSLCHPRACSARNSIISGNAYVHVLRRRTSLFVFIKHKGREQARVIVVFETYIAFMCHQRSSSTSSPVSGRPKLLSQLGQTRPKLGQRLTYVHRMLATRNQLGPHGGPRLATLGRIWPSWTRVAPQLVEVARFR